MNATPGPRSQQTEREELARLLPAAADRELSPHRHLLLKELLMDTVTEKSRHTAKRRNLALRVALPVGLAAALVGVVLAGGGSDRPVPGAAAVPGGTTPASPDAAVSPAPGAVANVAYTLESGGDDVVTLTILDRDKPVDVPRLQADLDRLGVRSRVYAGEPGCTAPDPSTPAYPEAEMIKANNGSGADRLAFFGWDIDNGLQKSVLTVRPHSIPADRTLFIHLPLAKVAPASGFRSLSAGLMVGKAPACMPAEDPSNPLASLLPTQPPGH
ncbi:hypothetical protein OH807_18990 [Kitasatospora sp. NBC_01560]|uniref:hypothetical protein n=1 Tax=Kitasatospora sp. NBC_01560 TaxID=2975965 RepID=UPI00386F4297